jgi:hypothetical protein
LAVFFAGGLIATAFFADGLALFFGAGLAGFFAGGVVLPAVFTGGFLPTVLTGLAGGVGLAGGFAVLVGAVGF